MGTQDRSASNSDRPERTTDVHAESPRPDQDVLESVLRETLIDNSEPLDPRLLESLRQLSRCHAGEPFALDPHGFAMVETILRSAWVPEPVAGVKTDAEWLVAATREVASRLAETDEVWQRIEKLWQQLGETVR